MDLDGSNQTQTELEGSFSEGQRITINKGDIYVGGYFQNGSCFWKNGSKTNLTVNADSMSWGIEVDQDNNLFSVGYCMKSHSLIPSYWKNGLRKNLSKPKHGDGEAKYIHGIKGKGFFTFYGGHDPEDYTHRVGDPKTELDLHPTSPGYRLILNNVLFPAAKKKKQKT